MRQVANKNDLIAVEESSVRGIFSTKVDMTKRGDAFSLADRDKILDNVEAEPVLVHIAQAEGTRCVAWRGMLLAMDVCAAPAGPDLRLE
jgi:hypothetical protein